MKDLCLKNIKLFEMVKAENLRQIKKWGVQDVKPFEWLAYTIEELGEISQAISEYHYYGGSSRNVVKETINDATLCLKIAEMFLDLDYSTYYPRKEEQ